MRPLVVTNDFPPRPGGIQVFVHQLCTGLDRPVVYAPAWREAESFDVAQPFPVVRHPSSLVLPVPAVRRTVVELVRAYECDTVVFGAAAPLALLTPALRRAGVVSVAALTHGHEAGWAHLPVGRQLLRRIGDQVDVLTYVGDYTRARIAPALSASAVGRLEQLRPGVDTDLFRPGNGGQLIRADLGLTGRRVAVCVSRLVPRKGQDTLIRAWPEVMRAVPDAALLLVGGGPSRQRLRELAGRLGVTDAVVFTGSVPRELLPGYFGAGDVFAMPCRARFGGLDVEALGQVFLEAAACGLPVLAGACGGAGDAVRDGETGYLVDGRRPADLARRLVDLFVNPTRAAAMGRAGRAWMLRDWRWLPVTAKLRALLDRPRY